VLAQSVAYFFLSDDSNFSCSQNIDNRTPSSPCTSDVQVVKQNMPCDVI
jgi:hypothetical protein